MRAVAFVTVLASFLAVMLAFGTTVATAQAPSGMKMEQYQTPAEQKAPISGDIKAPAAGEIKTEGMVKEGPTKSDVPVESRGGSAVVARVDFPDNCLRIRKDPSSSAEQIGCLSEGETLHLTGVFSQDRRWAQLDNNGWVFFGQLNTEVRPSGSWEKAATSPGKGFRGKGKRWHRGYYYGGCCGYPGYYGYGYGWSGYPTYYGWYDYPGYFGYSGFRGFPGLFGFRLF